MLLKCIKKLGKQVSASDRTDLEDWYNQHIESGLSEHAASAAALTDYHKVLFDATNAMRQAARVKPLPYQRYERPVREEIPPAKVEPSVQPEPSGGTKWNQGDVVTFNGLEGTIKDSYTDKYGESVVVDTANGEKVWPADKIKTTPPASVESSASGEVGGQMTVEEFESSGYELPSGLQNRGVTTIKARGSNKFDVTLKDGKVLSDVLINKSLGGKKVDNKALLTPSETTQIAYNGKMQDFDGEFKDAALKVAVNLSSTDKGYIKTPDGKVYEISSDKKRAKLLPDRITTTAPETRKTQETAAKISPTKKVEPKQPKLAEKEKTTPAATDATTEPRDIPDGTTVTKKVNRKTYTGVVETVDGKQRVGKVSDGKNVLPGTNKLDESWKPESLLHKGELTEPMKAILKEKVADIIDDAKFRTDGRVITAENIEGYGVLEQAVTKALGENMSLGRPLTPKETQKVIKAIQELAPDSKVGDRLVRMLKSASRGGRYVGVGIPESERHELFHALQLQLAAGKDAKTLPMSEVIAGIMSPELVKQILDSPLYKKATTDQLYAGSDALKANEFFTAMITGQFEYLGLNPQTDTAEMIELVRAWYADQKARYGDKIDKELYAKINTTTEFFIAELTQSETSNQEETRADRDIGERPTQERAGQADNAADTDEGVSKIGKSIESKAIEQGLTEGFPETAGYEKKHIKDQIQRVSNLIQTDYEQARRMVLGMESIPQSISPVMLLRGMEEVAKVRSDVDLMYDLANSPLVSETSRHAQEMRMMQEREQDSATTMIQNLRRARQAKIQKILGGRDIETAIKEEAAKLAKSIKGQTRTLKSRQSWATFIDALEC